MAHHVCDVPAKQQEGFRMDYKPPPLHRGLHPLKMNWLWRLICDVGHVKADDVIAALAKVDVRAERRRALGWLKSEGDDGYFPLTIAELEQNLRALQAYRPNPLPHEADNDSSGQP